MADFKAKAEAIWAALDEMASKNPETYKQFIDDQLNGEGAKEMLKQLKLGDSLFGMGPSSSSSGSSGPGPSVSSSSGGSSGSGSGATSDKSGGAGKYKGKGEEPDPVQAYRASIPSKKRSFLTTSNGRMVSGNNASSNSNGNGSSGSPRTKGATNAGSNSSSSRSPYCTYSHSLLDDAFSHSSLVINPLLAQIIADDEEDDELLLSGLRIPDEGSGDGQSQQQQPKNLPEDTDSNKEEEKLPKKKLIEEL